MKLLILALTFAAASSTKLFCYYMTDTPEYFCRGELTTSPNTSEYIIDDVNGTHLDGQSNSDVTEVYLGDTSMEALPKNLNTFFKNLRMLSLSNIAGLPNFKRSDFVGFKQLTNFQAGQINSVTRLPRDTFFDMTKLKILHLYMMPNMENFDPDMLTNLRELAVFSAHGPNKINQISAGFFRNQRETLVAVDFSYTNLIRVGHTVFDNLQVFKMGFFERAGCLYKWSYDKYTLAAAVRQQCQDVSAWIRTDGSRVIKFLRTPFH